MSFSLDPEVAAALAPHGRGHGGHHPAAVGDIDGRRAMWEPILAAASTALPITADVTTKDVEILN
jgi:hypothetical protein